jgi:hypothetical protein
MPWSQTSPMGQRTQVIADYLRETLSVSGLCELYGVSRKTGYKFIDRYLRQGPAGLEEIDDGIWNVCFGPLRLGRLHDRHMKIEDTCGRLLRHGAWALARESPAPLRFAGDSRCPRDRGHGYALPMSSDVSVTYLPGRSDLVTQMQGIAHRHFPARKAA